MIGSFTQHIDLPQVLLVAFGLFFAGLVVYLQRESKREGYPLEEEVPTVRHRIVGYPDVPPTKTYRKLNGEVSVLPQEYERRDLSAGVRSRAPGMPIYPVGDPLLAGIGPGSYTLRRDEPWTMHDGTLQLEPLREATDYTCVDPDLDPRGMRVFGSDFKQAGVVFDLWIDKESKILRYFEVTLDGIAERRLVPIFYAVISGKAKEIRITCLKADQLAKAPILRDPDSITAREEDRVNGFFAGGHMYSRPYKEALL